MNKYNKTGFSGVTILMATNRIDSFLGLAIESSMKSLDSLMGVEGELLLVADGIDSSEIAKTFSNLIKDSRFCIVQNNGRGLVAALNTGLSKAKYDLVARMDADDIMLENRLALQIDAFISRPNLVLLGGNIELINENGEVVRVVEYPNGNKTLKSMLRKGCFFAHPTVMFKKNVVLEAGGYDYGFAHAEDFALWVKLSKLGEIDNLDSVLIQYRSHANQVSNLHRDEQEASSRRIIELQSSKLATILKWKIFQSWLYKLRLFSLRFQSIKGNNQKLIRNLIFLITSPILTIRRIISRTRKHLGK